MKKVFPIAVVALVFLGLVVAGSRAEVATSSAVQIPEILRLAIGGFILAGVMLGLQAVFDSVGLDLRGIGAAIATVVSGFAIAQLQGLIDLIPAAYDQILTIVLNVAVVILSGLGGLRALLHRDRAAQLFNRAVE